MHTNILDDNRIFELFELALKKHKVSNYTIYKKLDKCLILDALCSPRLTEKNCTFNFVLSCSDIKKYFPVGTTHSYKNIPLNVFSDKYVLDDLYFLVWKDTEIVHINKLVIRTNYYAA